MNNRSKQDLNLNSHTHTRTLNLIGIIKGTVRRLLVKTSSQD